MTRDKYLHRIRTLHRRNDRLNRAAIAWSVFNIPILPTASVAAYGLGAPIKSILIPALLCNLVANFALIVMFWRTRNPAFRCPHCRSKYDNPQFFSIAVVTNTCATCGNPIFADTVAHFTYTPTETHTRFFAEFDAARRKLKTAMWFSVAALFGILILGTLLTPAIANTFAIAQPPVFITAVIIAIVVFFVALGVVEMKIKPPSLACPHCKHKYTLDLDAAKYPAHLKATGRCHTCGNTVFDDDAPAAPNHADNPVVKHIVALNKSYIKRFGKYEIALIVVLFGMLLLSPQLFNTLVDTMKHSPTRADLKLFLFASVTLIICVYTLVIVLKTLPAAVFSRFYKGVKCRVCANNMVDDKILVTTACCPTCGTRVSTNAHIAYM